MQPQNEVPAIEFARITTTSSSERLQTLEEDWRKRVESARARYFATLSDSEQVAERKLALGQYLRHLRVFADLVLKGKVPPEDR